MPVPADHPSPLPSAPTEDRACWARLEQAAASLPHGLGYLDRGLRFLFVNPALAAMNGRPVEDHVGRTVSEVVPGIADTMVIVLQRVLDTGEVQPEVEITGTVARDAGPPRHWRVSSFPVRGPAGEVTGVGCAFVDRTKEVRAQVALDAQRRLLTAILETLQEGVVAFRPGGGLAWANQAAQRLVGTAPREPSATLAEATAQMGIVGVDEQDRPLPEAQRVPSRVLLGETITGLEQRVHHRQRNETRWFLHNGTPVYDANGQLSLAVLTFKDITERKRAELARAAQAAELARANADLAHAIQLKDEFLAMMSHELRTPLNAVLGLTDAMRERVYGPLTDRQDTILNQVEKSGRHLLGVITDILDLAQIGAGTAVLERQPVDVKDLVHWALQVVEPTAGAKRVRLMRHVEHGVDRLQGDERRLRQILLNLVHNAVKFTPGGGTVALEVTADAVREHICFVVRDTGIGIAPADQRRLFQPFTQVDGSLSRRYGGVGLGLTLVRRLVDLHHGSIQLESTPGAGSCFTVTLPRSHADSAPSLVAPRLPSEPWKTPPRVLVADDHELTRDAYTDMLGLMGCVVTCAASSDEAVAKVRAERPDVVVMDLQMLGIDGLAAIGRLREEPVWASLPIIALAALVMPGDRERSLAAGVTRYLAKPVVMHDLRAAMAEVLVPGAAT
jgi:PAS domain S-box-containing protein